MIKHVPHRARRRLLRRRHRDPSDERELRAQGASNIPARVSLDAQAALSEAVNAGLTAFPAETLHAMGELDVLDYLMTSGVSPSRYHEVMDAWRALMSESFEV